MNHEIASENSVKMLKWKNSKNSRILTNSMNSRILTNSETKNEVKNKNDELSKQKKRDDSRKYLSIEAKIKEGSVNDSRNS